MIVIHSGRKTSRTTRLIEMSAADEAEGKVNYIVVSNHNRAYKVKQKADELGLSIGFPLTFEEFVRRAYEGKHIHHFYIDDADQFLNFFSWPVPIKAVVFEKTDEEA